MSKQRLEHLQTRLQTIQEELTQLAEEARDIYEDLGARFPAHPDPSDYMGIYGPHEHTSVSGMWKVYCTLGDMTRDLAYGLEQLTGALKYCDREYRR